MALAVQTEVSDGSLESVQVGIDFFEQSDVQVYLNLAADPLVEGTDYTWTASNTITFTEPPIPVGATVYLLRQTEIDRMFNIYDGGAGFTRLTLDENFKQLLLLAQEVREGVGLRGLYLPFNMNGYQIKNLGDGTADSDAINLGQLEQIADEIRLAYQAGDANLQAQLTGSIPLEASVFSPISWHSNRVKNSVAIPADVNAWSFGPTLTIDPGVSVTVGERSHWTIASGAESGPINSDSDFGEL